MDAKTTLPYPIDGQYHPLPGSLEADTEQACRSVNTPEETIDMKELWNRFVRVPETLWSRFKVPNAEQRRHEMEVNQAIERVVDQVNPLLKALGGYRKKLFPLVERAQEYLQNLALQVPGPVLINAQTWGSDPFVNSLFSSVDRMRWILSGPEVHNYLKQHPLGGDCFAIIAAYPDVKNQLGVELVGETLRRDVPQTAVSFRDHEVAVVSETEDKVRRDLARGALDLFISIAAQDILEQESRIAEVRERLRIVRFKLRVAETRSHGAGLLLDDHPDHGKEKEELKARVDELGKDLERERRGLASLDDYLNRLVELLAHPEVHLGLERVKVRLDRMNIVREGGKESAGAEIEFTRGRRGEKLARVLAIIRFPRSEVLEDGIRLQEAERYLG